MSVQQDSPAERVSTPVDGVDVLGALSPSRAGDFMTCPLLYRFRTIDRLPEQPSPDAVRGTVVHKVLEDLFDLPAERRTPDRAARHAGAGLGAAARGRARDRRDVRRPGGRRAGVPDLATWLTSCREVLDRYFTLEDPRRLEPAERELYVEALLDSRLLLRGFVDRIDVAPDGAIRVVDYKTGRSPGEMFEAKALFQMKFYALVLWRMRGVVPAMLQLDLPRQRRAAALRPRRAGPARHRAEGRGDLAGHPPRRGVRRLASAPQPAVRLVLLPGDLPGVRRHPAAAAGPARPLPSLRRRPDPGQPAKTSSGVTSWAVIRPAAMSSAKWQATRWPGPISRSSGRSVSQRVSWRNGQRVWKRQPAGGFAGDGRSPCSRIRSRVASTTRVRHGDRRHQRLRVGVQRLGVQVVGAAPARRCRRGTSPRPRRTRAARPRGRGR